MRSRILRNPTIYNHLRLLIVRLKDKIKSDQETCNKCRIKDHFDLLRREVSQHCFLSSLLFKDTQIIISI